MNTKRAVSIAELAVHLARISGVTNAWKVADVASKLTTLEVRAQRHAERLCNEPLPEGFDEKARESLGRRAAVQLARIGLEAVRVSVGGDPRGCCLKLYHSGLSSNGFGGDGYSVGA